MISRGRAASLALGVGAALSLAPSTAPAVDVNRMPFTCLVAASDAVVLGRAGGDEAAGYRVDVEEVVTGEPLRGRVGFRTSPWQGPANQPAGPALLFLRQPGVRPGWEIVGLSGEGWRPVSGGTVDLAGLGLEAGGQRYQLAGVVSALRALDRCVRWTREPARARIAATLVCDEARRSSLKRGGGLAAELISAAEAIATASGAQCAAVGERPAK